MAQPIIRNRITGYQLVKKEDLVLHPAHVWEHPDEEKARLSKVVGERGNLSALLTRKLPSGKFEILDGKMRFEELGAAGVVEFGCLLCDLNDAEAVVETREHNILGHQSITTEPSLLALLKSFGGDRIPDVSNLLKDAPLVNGKPENATVKKEEREAKAAVKEAKAEPELKCVYILTVLPLDKFGEARPHLAALESMAEVTVQRSGEEPVAN